MVKKCLGIVVAIGFIFCIVVYNAEAVTRTWDGGIDADTKRRNCTEWVSNIFFRSIFYEF